MPSIYAIRGGPHHGKKDSWAEASDCSFLVKQGYGNAMKFADTDAEQADAWLARPMMPEGKTALARNYLKGQHIVVRMLALSFLTTAFGFAIWFVAARVNLWMECATKFSNASSVGCIYSHRILSIAGEKQLEISHIIASQVVVAILAGWTWLGSFI